MIGLDPVSGCQGVPSDPQSHRCTPSHRCPIGENTTQTDRQTHFIDHRTCAHPVVTTGVVDMRRNTSQSYNFHMDPLKTG